MTQPDSSAPPSQTNESGQVVGGPSLQSTVAATWALFAGILLLMVGNGLQGTLVGVRAAIEDFDTIATGVMMSGYFAGFLVGSRTAVQAVRRVGHIRVFAALASLASSAFLLHSIWVHPISWALMRLATGFCMAGLYVVAESWLNDQATNENRGRILSIYMVVTMGGISIGQLFLNVADVTGFTLFILASVLVSLSLVPMTLSAASAPPITEPSPLSFKEAWSIVPTGLITIFCSGFSAGALLGLAAVYAASVGMSEAEISLFAGAAYVGAMVFQVPIGTVSDRLPRRGVLLVVALLAAVVAVGGVVADETGWQPIVVMFALGGMTFPIYSMAIALTNDWIPPNQRAGAAVLLVSTNGVGAVLGPIVTSVVIAQTGDDAFFWALAAIHVLLAAYLAVRIIVRDPLPIDEQTEFAPIPARASSVIYGLTRRRRKPKP